MQISFSTAPKAPSSRQCLSQKVPDDPSIIFAIQCHWGFKLKTNSNYVKIIFSKDVHIRGSSGATVHETELHHAVFFMFREYRERESERAKLAARDKRYKDKSRCRKKKLSHNVVVFTVLHQAGEGLLNTEKAG